MFEFDEWTVDEAKERYRELWDTAVAALPGLTDEQIAIVVSLATNVCTGCHAHGDDCYCMRDD